MGTALFIIFIFTHYFLSSAYPMVDVWYFFWVFFDCLIFFSWIVWFFPLAVCFLTVYFFVCRLKSYDNTRFVVWCNKAMQTTFSDCHHILDNSVIDILVPRKEKTCKQCVTMANWFCNGGDDGWCIVISLFCHSYSLNNKIRNTKWTMLSNEL